ncbi:MAG: hypothetical protein ACREBS_09210 [Nitrososphaerales archaeon]
MGLVDVDDVEEDVVDDVLLVVEVIDEDVVVVVLVGRTELLTVVVLDVVDDCCGVVVDVDVGTPGLKTKADVAKAVNKIMITTTIIPVVLAMAADSIFSLCTFLLQPEKRGVGRAYLTLNEKL